MISSANNLRLWPIKRYWLILFLIVWGIVVWTPFLPPLLMQIGREGLATVIYRFYSLLCHQMPQRSYFLFGEQFSYELGYIQTVFQNTQNPLLLRQFVGTTATGWKVAWSDRMISLYGGMWLWMLIWGLLPGRRRQLPFWVFMLLAIPMALDGTSHMLSDFFLGIGSGFRDSNTWLADLTGNLMPGSFYRGDSIGTFNSWMRLLSGLLFSLGLIWWLLPKIEAGFHPNIDDRQL
jgi:uncharacterized membrane protein